jgi:hypothetical protein
MPTENLAITDPPEDEAHIRALRGEIQTLKKRLERMRGGEDIILHAVREAWEEPPKLVVPKAPQPSRRKREEKALLHVTDTQIGKLTESYSTAVAEERLIRLADKVRHITEVRRSSAAVNEIVVLLGGDMVEGESIFPGQSHQIDQGLFEQACKTAPAIFVRLILSLLQTFPKVRVACVSGNHGRSAPRSVGSHPLTNWDRVCYQITRDILLGTEQFPRKDLQNRLTFEIPDTFYTVQYIYDWGVLCVHGDQIRGGWAGFPLYGTAKKVWGWIDSIPEEFDLILFGHFHQYASGVLNYREYFAGGTTESGNVYAQEQMAATGWPIQRLMFFDKEQGIISEDRIYLNDPGERLPQKVRRGKSQEKA